MHRAAEANDAWLIGRAAPLAFDSHLSPRTVDALERSLPTLAATACWGLVLRLLARQGRNDVVSRAARSESSDPRAVLAALAEIGEPAPKALREAEPATAEILDYRQAPAPALDTLL